MANVRLPFALAPLVKVQSSGVPQSFNKSIGEQVFFGFALSARHVFPLTASGFVEQAKDFQIQPDERDHHTECAIPFHILWRPVPYTGFDHVEVEDQIQCCDDHHKQTETNANEAVAIDGRDLDVKENAENHLHQV